MTAMREQLGAAVNASDLAGDAEHERHIDRIGAMAIASLRDGQIDPQGTLGATLIRARLGGDRFALKKAALLLVQYVQDGAAARWKLRAPLSSSFALRFVTIVLEEWVNDKCQHCTGRGRLLPEKVTREKSLCRACAGAGITRLFHVLFPDWKAPRKLYGKRRPRHGTTRKASLAQEAMLAGAEVWCDIETCSTCKGSKKLDARKINRGVAAPVCRACTGTGDRKISPKQRAVAIGVTPEAYDRHWGRRFDDLKAKLSALDGHVVAHTRLQLEKEMRTVAPY